MCVFSSLIIQFVALLQKAVNLLTLYSQISIKNRYSFLTVLSLYQGDDAISVVAIPGGVDTLIVHFLHVFKRNATPTHALAANFSTDSKCVISKIKRTL